jgi:hypothetical protein
MDCNKEITYLWPISWSCVCQDVQHSGSDKWNGRLISSSNSLTENSTRLRVQNTRRIRCYDVWLCMFTRQSRGAHTALPSYCINGIRVVALDGVRVVPDFALRPLGGNWYIVTRRLDEKLDGKSSRKLPYGFAARKLCATRACYLVILLLNLLIIGDNTSEFEHLKDSFICHKTRGTTEILLERKASKTNSLPTSY